MPQSLADQFRFQARNNAWSNARLSRACAALRPEAFAAPRVSFFPSLRGTLQHILFVDRRYLADLTGPGRATVGRAELPGAAAALGAAQLETDRWLIAFCDGLDAPDLARVVRPAPRSRRARCPFAAGSTAAPPTWRSTRQARCLHF